MLRDTIIKSAVDSGLTWRGPWFDGTSYVVNDLVENDGDVYICILDHIANWR